MKIICDAPGQTCNRLWSYIATISECVVKKKKMIILFYDYTIEDFPNFRYCPFIFFPLYHKWYLERGNGWNNFKGFTWKMTHNKTMNKLFVFFGCFKGWHTRRDVRYISKAKSEIIHIFTPKLEIVVQASSLISKMRETADLIIGVHIRLGDYKVWHNGCFYFELSQYHVFMKRVQSLYKEKRVAFFICSNEKFSANIFNECECYRFQESSSVILDLYTLSLTDRIIGPFSTFSRWASFIGEKPICFLEDEHQTFTEESFSPIIDFFHYANGKEILDW
ncbi:MAG: hypothetical protein PHX50_08540 [Massilibacteroides sp.]|nr:hypothetical protein [Massilibacteroides sp.]